MSDLKNIEAIVFDLGGVILNIDFALTQKELERLGLKDAGAYFGKYTQSGFFDKLDRGEIQQAELFKEISKLLHMEATEQQLLKAWNSMILDFPASRIDLLKKLRKKYKIYLLSNTNTIHYNYYNERIRHLGEESLDALFDGVFYSFRLGMRKPEKRIFQAVLDSLNIESRKILFVDDTEMHLSAAEEFQMQTIHISETKDICDVFSDYLK